MVRGEQKRDLVSRIKNIQLDFMQMQEFEKKPLIFTEGEGVYIKDIDGRTYLDGISGVFVVNIGYGNRRVKEAMRRAVEQLEFAPPLHGTTGPALMLASKLAEILPEPLNVAKLSSGGSEATECAVKWARQYHIQTGNPLKFKVISRHWSYHGATKGALSASGVRDKVKFEPLAAGYCHVLPPYEYRCPFRCGGNCNNACAEAIEWEIKMQGPETVSAVIADPVMAAAGVLVPGKDYYRILREVCYKYNVLLIFDEIVTGFGRVGSMFASDYYGVVPDIICLGKGMASGYAPLSATVVRDEIAEAFRGEASSDKAFLHGTTYGGHPLACATGLAVIDEIVDRRLPENSKMMGEYLMGRLRGIMESHPIIGDVRGLGLLIGMEFVRDRESRELFSKDRLAAPKVRDLAMENGLITRASAHVLALAPPLILDREQADQIAEILGGCVAEAEEWIKKR